MPFITEFFLSFCFVFVHSTIIGSHRIRLGLFPNRELVTTSVVLVMFTGFYWVLRCLTRFSCQEKGCYRVLPSFFFPHKDSSESTTGSLKCSLWLFVVALATGVPVPVSALVPGSDEFLPSFFFLPSFIKRPLGWGGGGVRASDRKHLLAFPAGENKWPRVHLVVPTPYCPFSSKKKEKKKTQ